MIHKALKFTIPFTLAVTSAVFFTASVALAVDQQIAIDPLPNMKLGSGYDSKNFKVKEPCIEFNKNLERKNSSRKNTVLFTEIESKEDLASAMELSVNASVQALTPFATVNVDSKTSLATSTRSGSYYHSILATQSIHEKAKFIDTKTITFTPKAKLWLAQKNFDRFIQECGTHFIMGAEVGHDFHGTAYVKKQDTESSNNFEQEVSADVTSGSYNANVAIDYATKMDHSFGVSSISVQKITSLGDSSAPTSVVELVQQFQNFNKNVKSSDATELLYYAQEWEYLKSFPKPDYTKPISDKQKVRDMINAAYRYDAKISDINFIIQNPNMFALGIKKSQRNEQLKKLKKALSHYKNTSNDLKKKIPQCYQDFDKSCAESHEKFSNVNLEVHKKQLPKKYLFDCRPTAAHKKVFALGNIAKAIADTKNSKMDSSGETSSGYFLDQVAHDDEFGGNPAHAHGYSYFTVEDDTVYLERYVEIVEFKSEVPEGEPAQIYTANSTKFVDSSKTEVFTLQGKSDLKKKMRENCEFFRSNPIDIKPKEIIHKNDIKKILKNKHGYNDQRLAGLPNQIYGFFSAVVPNKVQSPDNTNFNLVLNKNSGLERSYRCDFYSRGKTKVFCEPQIGRKDNKDIHVYMSNVLD